MYYKTAEKIGMELDYIISNTFEAMNDYALSIKNRKKYNDIDKYYWIMRSYNNSLATILNIIAANEIYDDEKQQTIKDTIIGIYKAVRRYNAGRGNWNMRSDYKIADFIHKYFNS